MWPAFGGDTEIEPRGGSLEKQRYVPGPKGTGPAFKDEHGDAKGVIPGMATIVLSVPRSVKPVSPVGPGKGLLALSKLKGLNVAWEPGCGPLD